MNALADSHLPSTPQTGRSAPSSPTTEPRNLWQQFLATVNGVGNVIDPFASDAEPEVRALGQMARQRTPRSADDYFVLGDMCARLSLDGMTLRQPYAEKVLIAYCRAGECSTTDAVVARRAILAFAFWVASVARMIASYEALQVGVAICERAGRLDMLASDSAPVGQLRHLVEQMRAQITQMLDEGERAGGESSPQRISRRLCDEGQNLLRHQRTEEALNSFARAIEIDEQNSTAWLWQALALTDVARFDEALASYDRSIQLDPTNYGAWNSKGTLLMELGRAIEALDCFERALAMPLPPPVVKAAFLLNKGKALYILGRYEEARDALVRSDQLDPTPESSAGIAACHEMLGLSPNATE